MKRIIIGLAAVVALVVAMTVAAAPGPRGEISASIVTGYYGQPVAVYDVVHNNGPVVDWVIRHECQPSGYVFTNRVYWDQPSHKTGSWNTNVTSGETCTGTLIELNDYFDPGDDEVLATVIYAVP